MILFQPRKIFFVICAGEMRVYCLYDLPLNFLIPTVIVPQRAVHVIVSGCISRISLAVCMSSVVLCTHH